MDGTPPAVFCGDAWRIFEWELGCEALPMDNRNGYVDYNLLLNDDEFWNGGEMRRSPAPPPPPPLPNSPPMQPPPTANLMLQPYSASELELHFTPRKRERQMLGKSTENGGHCYPPSKAQFSSSALCMRGAPFANAQFPDGSCGMTLNCTKTAREQTFALIQSSGTGASPLNALCEPLCSNGLIYTPDHGHQGADTFRGMTEPRAKKTKTNATSQYKGVTKHRQTGKFEAHLWDATVIRRGKERRGRKRGKQIYLGGFTNELAAARTYDMAAICFWGDVAVTNFPIEDYAADREFLKSTDKHSIVKILRRSAGGYRAGSKIFSGLTLGGFLDVNEVS